MNVGKYQIDQIALYVRNADVQKKRLNEVFGLQNWVEDRVTSELVLFDSSGNPHIQEVKNVVNLRFNYEIIKNGVEFELLQIAENSYGYHMHLNPPCISHFGCHVDDLSEAVDYFEKLGYPPIQQANTQEHTGTSRRYRYVFVDTRPLLGYYLKLIKRLED